VTGTSVTVENLSSQDLTFVVKGKTCHVAAQSQAEAVCARSGIKR